MQIIDGQVALRLAVEVELRDLIQADYDRLPAHLKALRMGQDRLECLVMCDRTIARLERQVQQARGATMHPGYDL